MLSNSTPSCRTLGANKTRPLLAQAAGTFGHTHLFSEMESCLLTKLLTTLNPLKCAAKEHIFDVGDQGADIYIITSGIVRLHIPDISEVAPPEWQRKRKLRKKGRRLHGSIFGSQRSIFASESSSVVPAEFPEHKVDDDEDDLSVYYLSESSLFGDFLPFGLVPERPFTACLLFLGRLRHVVLYKLFWC